MEPGDAEVAYGARAASRSFRKVARLGVALVLACAPGGAYADIDAIVVEHRAGPCSNFGFPAGTVHRKVLGSNGTGIPIATGETVAVTVYGPGIDQATDATGQGLFEWIDVRGKNAQAKAFVRIAVRAEAQHGTGHRVVTIRWASVTTPAVATLRFTVVGTCAELNAPGLRIAPVARS